MNKITGKDICYAHWCKIRWPLNSPLQFFWWGKIKLSQDVPHGESSDRLIFPLEFWKGEHWVDSWFSPLEILRKGESSGYLILPLWVFRVTIGWPPNYLLSEFLNGKIEQPLDSPPLIFWSWESGGLPIIHLWFLDGEHQFSLEGSIEQPPDSPLWISKGKIRRLPHYLLAGFWWRKSNCRSILQFKIS